MTQNILINNWGISSSIIITQAETMWLTCKIISQEKNLYSINNWEKTVYFKSVDCWINSSFWLKAANDKELSYVLWEKNNIIVPKSLYLNKGESLSLEELEKKLTLPVISKPIDGAHGDGVFLNIKDEETLQKAITYSFLNDVNRVVIQEQIQWEDHRIIVIWDKVVAWTKRVPPEVIGNGINTIQELIKKENTHPDRLGSDHENKLSPIKVDSELQNCLSEQGYTLSDILEESKQIYVRKNANLSSWWKAIDVTDIIHQDIKTQCVKLSQLLWLKMCWVDVFSTNISRPLDETNWAIIEVNATPWIRMHHFPSIGNPRNVAWELLEFIFKK
jgi:cyanophycin synthetase